MKERKRKTNKNANTEGNQHLHIQPQHPLEKLWALQVDFSALQDRSCQLQDFQKDSVLQQLENPLTLEVKVKLLTQLWLNFI